jgi:antitoxin ParD1/3/4/toxin ParE1/3/4
MSRYLLTRSAEADLLEIWTFVADDSPDAADRFEARLFAVMARLAEYPAMGHRRRDLTDKSYLFHSLGSYLIVYDPSSKPIRILRVLHGARDVKSLLDQ